MNVVLLHGWGMNRRVFDPLVKQLKFNSPSYQILALDLPGYGLRQATYQDDGEVAQDAFSVAASADQLVLDLAHLQGPTVLLGWSLGGLVALKLYERIHQMQTLQLTISGIAMVASTPCFMKSEQWPGIEARVLESFEQQLVNEYEALLSRFLAIQFMQVANTRRLQSELRRNLLEEPVPSSAALAVGLKELNRQDLRSLFSSVTHPIRGFFGRLDSLVPARVVPELSALNHHFVPIIYEQSSHAPFISEESAFVCDLIEFIEQVRG